MILQTELEELSAALIRFKDFDEWLLDATSPSSVEEIELLEAVRTIAKAAEKWQFVLQRQAGV